MSIPKRPDPNEYEGAGLDWLPLDQRMHEHAVAKAAVEFVKKCASEHLIFISQDLRDEARELVKRIEASGWTA